MFIRWQARKLAPYVWFRWPSHTEGQRGGSTNERRPRAITIEQFADEKRIRGAVEVSIHRPIGYYAYVCKSQRIDGVPRSKTVAYLGTISSEVNLYRRHNFWQAADLALATLNLDRGTRENLEAKLAKKVARFTAGEQLELEADRKASNERMAELMAEFTSPAA